MINLTLQNPAGTLTAALHLPATRYDYAEVRARLKCRDLAACRVTHVTAPGLDALTACFTQPWYGRDAVAELQWLAVHLESIEPEEQAKFDVLCKIHRPDNLVDLLNLTAHLEGLRRWPGFRFYDEVARFVIAQGELTIPPELDGCVSLYDLGRKYIESHPVALQDGFLYADETPPQKRKAYDGQTLPAQPPKPTWLFLVDEDLTLPRTKLHATMRCTVKHSRIQAFADVFQQPVSLQALNELSKILEQMSEEVFAKLLAVLSLQRLLPQFVGQYVTTTPEQILGCVATLDLYEFNPDITPADVNEYGLIRCKKLCESPPEAGITTKPD